MARPQTAFGKKLMLTYLSTLLLLLNGKCGVQGSQKVAEITDVSLPEGDAAVTGVTAMAPGYDQDG